MENADDYKRLDTAEAVLALDGLVVKRIVRSYNFETPVHYVWRTSILFQNSSIYHDCFIVPGEFYEEGILIDFEAYDGNRVEAIRVPSHENNSLLVKYIFFKMIKYVEESDRSESEKQDIKKVLCYYLTNKEEYLKKGNFSDRDIKKALDEKLEGPLAEKFLRSMWKRTKDEEEKKKGEEEDMKAYLDKNLTEYLVDKDRKPQEVKEILENLEDLKIKGICSPETQDFICRFDGHFLQLVLLKNPIPAGEQGTVTLETDRFRPGQKKIRLSEKIELPIDIRPLLPDQDGSTLHYMVRSPEGIQFMTRLYLRHKLIRKRPLLSEEEELNPNYFDIFHDSNSSSERCKELLELLDIFEKPGESRPGIPARIDKNLIALYFGNPRKELKPFCNKDHKAKIHLGVDKIGIYIFYYLLVFFLIILSILSFYWFNQLRLDPYAYTKTIETIEKGKEVLEIPSSFWTFAFFVVAQSISVIFDYSRRSDAQRYFMKPSIFFIRLFMIVVIFLLLLIVVFPIIFV